MESSYILINTFLDHTTTKFLYLTNKKLKSINTSELFIDTISFMKTLEIESKIKTNIIPYASAIKTYTNIVTKVNTESFCVYVLIYNKYHSYIHIVNDNKDITLHPGDAVILNKNVLHRFDIKNNTAIFLELEYDSPDNIFKNNLYSYQKYLDIDIQNFWKTDYLQVKTKEDALTLYNIEDFPAFNNLSKHLINTFIEEAILVNKVIDKKNTIYRRKTEWDDKDSVITLREIINNNNNTSWITAQYNSDWLNYPLIYYDESLGGKAEELCPNILNYLKTIKNIRIAGLSLLKKKGIITPHSDSTGLSNNSLACHICLTGNGILTVDNINISQEPYKVFIFDSEITHSAINDNEEDRIILYIDFIFSKHYKPKRNIHINTYTKLK